MIASSKLAERFSELETRKKFIDVYGNIHESVTWENKNGEKVEAYVSRESGIVLNTYQENGWLCVHYYDSNGYSEGETYDGIWKETDEPRPVPRPHDPLCLLPNHPKKYTVDDYNYELEKARNQSCRLDEIEKIMRPFLARLHQGLRVGDGVTVNLYTDRHAGTVVRRTKTRLFIRRDDAFRVDNCGMSDCQKYRYARDPNGEVYLAHWSEKHCCFFFGGCKDGKPISVGRHEYYDFTF